ncbi:MAG TPA: tetratricopeptide repeat protein [Polyangiaceae bacterium]|jgi:predicted ATPase
MAVELKTLQSYPLFAPLVGREVEMADLCRALTAVSSSAQPQVVTVVAAGGMGKSRLIEDFIHDSVRQAPSAPRVYRGRARARGLSYGVFARLLRSRFGLQEDADPELARAQLREQAARVLEDRKVGDVCFFLAKLMDLPFEQSPLTRAVQEDAVQARFLSRAIVKNFIERDAERSPLCLVFEDLHFADDDSLDLLSYLVENLRGTILLLCTARAELVTRSPAWFQHGRGRHRRLDLGPLGAEHAAEIMRHLLAPCEGGPREALVESAVNMAGGNPGLLQAMVRIFHDAGVLSEEPASERQPVWKVDLDRLASVRLPFTVDDAISLRVGALSAPDRRVLEHASVMGSVFWLGGLIALSRMDQDAPEFWDGRDSIEMDRIGRILDDLIRRDYILKLRDSAFAGDVEYVFKHNLEREKLAELTSAAARQRYHQTIADWLSQREHLRSQEEYCAMLAFHLEQAGSHARAGQTYLQAGDIAREHYAAKKAHEYYTRGLDLLGTQDARRRIDALHNHGDVLLLLGKTDEALAMFREMLKTAYRLGLKGKGGAAHNRIGRLYRDIGSLGPARQHLDTARGLFEVAKDERGIAGCHDDTGVLHWLKGDYTNALKHMKIALEMRKRLGDRRSLALSLNNVGMVWMDHGQDAQAAEALEASLKIRREVGDSLGVVESLNNLGRLAQGQNLHERALKLFREAYEVAVEIGEHNRIATVLTNVGETCQRLGDTEQAIRILKQAEELCDELGDKLHLAEAKRGLAKAYLQQQELLKARQSIKHAVDLFGQVRSKVRLAAALRTLGEVTGAGAWGEGHEIKAVDYFMRSVAIAKEIGNELELAKSYRAFANYVTTSPEYSKNTAIQREAKKLGQMADEIFSRHHPAEPIEN